MARTQPATQVVPEDGEAEDEYQDGTQPPMAPWSPENAEDSF